MNPAFVTLYGGTGGILGPEEDAPGRNGWRMRTLKVDSMNDNRYTIQFYKKQSDAVGSGNIICNHYVATASTGS
jgi:hypothetical protein